MPPITKVLIANRGEIAVRVIRAAKDSGISSVAVYADQDRDSMHSHLADESYGLNGTTSADTYLVIEKLLSVARRSGADAVHPGYGFLAENADFARAVIGAGLTWIGPSPDAIEKLGDKVSARHVAEKVHAPMAPGTLNPVVDAAEVLDFVDLHAYPGLGGTWDQIGPAYGLDETRPDGPLLLGEFGAFEQAYPDPEDGAAALVRFQAESCEWGFNGWLLWFWGADQDDEVITADAHDAVIGEATSPRVRPDPCDVGTYRSANLALERPVTASAEDSADYAASHVTDGSDATWWSAADGAPQWIEIDLETPARVASVQILVGDVSPPGPQTHRVYVRGEDEPAPGRRVGEATADARHGDRLTVEFEPEPDVRFVRVETVAVDGWVILHEIEVLAEAG